jgi:hypothetical protein
MNITAKERLEQNLQQALELGKSRLMERRL